MTRRAGLLIEVGDRQYSFVHLTFQEYLTAAHIITSGETEGVAAIWKSIKTHCDDPRWAEVIRLLVAALKSEQSQEVLIQLLSDSGAKKQRKSPRSLLLAGLLLDGIEPAEVRQAEIIHDLLRTGAEAKNQEGLRAVVSMLRAWLVRAGDRSATIEEAFRSVSASLRQNDERMALALVASIIEIPSRQVVEMARGALGGSTRDSLLLHFFWTKILSEERLQFSSQIWS